jgi:hypothetical protein
LNLLDRFFLKIKSSNIKFHQNSSTGVRVVPGGQTDMTKIIVALAQFCERAQNLPLASENLYSIAGIPAR